MSSPERVTRALHALARPPSSTPPRPQIRRRASATRRRRRLARGATILTANLLLTVVVAVVVARLTATADDSATTVIVPATLDRELREAARTGDLATVEGLLRAGADPNTSGGFGLTALAIAIVRDDSPVTSVLLDAGADPHLRTDAEATALHLASRYASPEIVAAVLDTAPDTVGHHDARIATPLHLAMARGDVTIIDILLEAGADPTALDGHLRTPLHHALDGTDPLTVIRHFLTAVDKPLIATAPDLDAPLTNTDLAALTDTELLDVVAVTDPDRR